MPTIKCLVIPADNQLPIRTEEFERDDLAAMQRLVGGYLEVINLDNPPCSLFMNEDGRFLRRPANERATLILQVGKPAFIGAEPLVGDCLIVGAPDGRGNDTTVPDELVTLLLEAEQFNVDIQRSEGGPWERWSSGLDIPWQIVYESAIEIIEKADAGIGHWAGIVGVRVLPV